jgi:hypothetical protein
MKNFYAILWRTTENNNLIKEERRKFVNYKILKSKILNYTIKINYPI